MMLPKVTAEGTPDDDEVKTEEGDKNDPEPEATVTSTTPGSGSGGSATTISTHVAGASHSSVSPATGDNTHILPAMALAFLSLITSAVILGRRRAVRNK